MQQTAPQHADQSSDAAWINQEFYSHQSVNPLTGQWRCLQQRPSVPLPAFVYIRVTGNRKERCGRSANQQAHIASAMNKAFAVTSVIDSLQRHHQLDFFMSNAVSSSPTHKDVREFSLGLYPELQCLQNDLRAEFTKIWPTRYKPLCPPAFAALRPFGDLMLDEVIEADMDRDLSNALVIYLPDDLEASLVTLAKTDVVPRVHHDIGLKSSGAYWSWTLPAPQGQLPRSVWVLCDGVKAALEENHGICGEHVLPVVWIAGHSVVVSDWRPSADLLEKGRKAMATAAKGPTESDPAALKAAADKALRYGERPWLFMRYELRNGYGRLAVNWAPVHAK